MAGWFTLPKQAAQHVAEIKMKATRPFLTTKAGRVLKCGNAKAKLSV